MYNFRKNNWLQSICIVVHTFADCVFEKYGKIGIFSPDVEDDENIHRIRKVRRQREAS